MILLIEQQAREQLQMPPEWRLFRWECFPKTGTRVLYYEVTGAVAPLITRGKRAGNHDWRKRDKTTQRTVHITPDEHEAWLRAWEARTGLCSGCAGEGQVMKSWSADTGTVYKTCSKCNGTKKAAPVAVKVG